jgi:hypothetical protein
MTDDELRRLDVEALLRESDPPAELQGEGAVAAALQLRDDDVQPADVFQVAGEVRDDDVLAGDPPTLLDRYVAAGLEGSGREALAHWLEQVLAIMTMHEAQR